MKEEGRRRKEEENPRSPVSGSFILHPSSFLLAVIAAAVLAGCGSKPPRIDRLPGDAGAPPARGGGYYLDDGPGASPPANLDGIPDAVPRIEPLHRGTMRPYTVMGRSYSPMIELAPYRARGIATWYGRRYHGRQTASGEIYDMYAMTAAHTVLPIPSYVRVTNVANGRSVVVRVNDRGPFVGDRLIDLSYAAAHRIGMIGAGSALVDVESVLPGQPPAEMVASTPQPETPPAPAVAVIAPEPEIVSSPLPAQPAPAAAPTPPVSAPIPSTPAPQLPVASVAGGIYLQLGAFGSRGNAESYLARLKLELGGLAQALQIVDGGTLHRVHAGPYATEAEAREIAARIGAMLGTRPFVLTR